MVDTMMRVAEKAQLFVGGESYVGAVVFRSNEG